MGFYHIPVALWTTLRIFISVIVMLLLFSPFFFFFLFWFFFFRICILFKDMLSNKMFFPKPSMLLGFYFWKTSEKYQTLKVKSSLWSRYPHLTGVSSHQITESCSCLHSFITPMNLKSFLCRDINSTWVWGSTWQHSQPFVHHHLSGVKSSSLEYMFQWPQKKKHT